MCTVCIVFAQVLPHNETKVFLCNLLVNYDLVIQTKSNEVPVFLLQSIPVLCYVH